MNDKESYFARAESWAMNAQISTARSRRTAWIVAGVASGVAALEAVMFAFLLPLKTVQPVTLLVDRQTGFAEAIDPAAPKQIAADEALTQSLLAQYVTAREGFDRATVALDYRRVGLWSGGAARASYLAMMPATNPASPLNAYPPGTIVSVGVKSVSRLSPDSALVRFDTTRLDRGGRGEPPQPWISVIRYRFINAPMRFEDRLVNPLGLQVVGYRRDAEALPAPAPVETAAARPVAADTFIDASGRLLHRVRIPAAGGSRLAPLPGTRAQSLYAQPAGQGQ